jgi:hypothetical protein
MDDAHPVENGARRYWERPYLAPVVLAGIAVTAAVSLAGMIPGSGMEPNLTYLSAANYALVAWRYARWRRGRWRPRASR